MPVPSLDSTVSVGGGVSHLMNLSVSSVNEFSQICSFDSFATENLVLEMEAN